MKKFRTHIVLESIDSNLIRKLNINISPIMLELSPEPTKLFWRSIIGNDNAIIASGIIPQSGFLPADELIIIAENEEVAEDNLNIILSGALLGYPQISKEYKNTYLNDIEEINDELYSKDEFKKYYKRLELIGYGCLILSKVNKDLQLMYALEKYKLSLELCSMTPHSAHPKYGQIFENYTVLKQYHTKAAFAIISAYSVIEELGLEIRSSSAKPRFLNKETGEWNPDVLNDINNRLGKIGISQEDNIEWIFRGDKTNVERDLKPYFNNDSKWCKYGAEIRDKTLTFPEALHNTSYLRNFIAAHKFRDIIQYISPYDVFNVQCLARNLLLRKLKLWQIDIYAGI